MFLKRQKAAEEEEGHRPARRLSRARKLLITKRFAGWKGKNKREGEGGGGNQKIIRNISHWKAKDIPEENIKNSLKIDWNYVKWKFSFFARHRVDIFLIGKCKCLPQSRIQYFVIRNM